MRSEGLELRRRGIRRVVVGVSKVCTGLSHILRWKGGGGRGEATVDREWAPSFPWAQMPHGILFGSGQGLQVHG